MATNRQSVGQHWRKVVHSILNSTSSISEVANGMPICFIYMIAKVIVLNCRNGTRFASGDLASNLLLDGDKRVSRS